MRTTADLRSAMLTFDPGWTVDLDQIRSRVARANRRRRIATVACATVVALTLGGAAAALTAPQHRRPARQPVPISHDLAKLPTTPLAGGSALPAVPETGRKAAIDWNHFTGWLEPATRGTPQVCLGDGTTNPYCAPLRRSQRGWLSVERYGSGYTTSTLVFAVIDAPLATVVVATDDTEISSTVVDLGRGYRLVVAPVDAGSGGDTGSRIRLWGFDSRGRLVGYADLS